MAPFESRIHAYINPAHDSSQPKCHLNLANIFDALDMEDEFKKELHELDQATKNVPLETSQAPVLDQFFN